jgi:uncharacterized membrane protein YfcA
VRVIAYVLSGLITLSLVAGSLIAAPFAVLGLKLGSRIHVAMSQQQMRRVIGVLLIMTGAGLLIRTLAR